MNPQYASPEPHHGFNNGPGYGTPPLKNMHTPQAGSPLQNYTTSRPLLQQAGPPLGMPPNGAFSGPMPGMTKTNMPLQGTPLPAMPPSIHHLGHGEPSQNGPKSIASATAQYVPPGRNPPNMQGGIMPPGPPAPNQNMPPASMTTSSLQHTTLTGQMSGLHICQQPMNVTPRNEMHMAPPMKTPGMPGGAVQPPHVPLLPPTSATGGSPMMNTSKSSAVNGVPENRGGYVNGSSLQTSDAMMPPFHPSAMMQTGPIPPQQHALQPQQHALPPYMGHGQPNMPPMQSKPTYPAQPVRPPDQYPGQHLQQSTYPSQQSQQVRRLDPEQMPSPIQMMQEDQRLRSGPFVTNQRGQVPPLVTTHFITKDEGNSSPRFMRASMYSVPATIDMMKQTAIPFGLVISPLAETLHDEQPIPIVDMGELGPVRCIRCKAYMCPLMQFIDGGRRFHCLLCKATSEVPPEYFQHLDHTGQRVDRYQRPELLLGTYEFVATKDYCRNNTFPKTPALIFLIDVSYNNIKSGMVNLLCQEMRNILRNIPKDVGQEESNMRVGFITYSNAVHFYNIKNTLAQPKMMVVGNTHDMFTPLLDGFLCSPYESEELIDTLMEQIPAMFADTRETETILAPAIQAGLEALKASECAGKLLVFHSSLPIADSPGKLKNRDDRKVLGTDKEKTVLSPQNTFYNNLGQDCVAAGCSVDLFIFNNSYVDLATISQVSRLTGGEVYKYTYFQSDTDGPRLIADITRNISRTTAFDAIMRVRTSTGVRPTEFFGHFFMSNTTDMELASIDSDKAIAVEIKHDDKLTEEEGVFIQVALLYTSCGGQRRLRILNLALKTCIQMADLYRGCDLDTIVNFLAKQSMVRLLENAPKPVKDALVSRCAQILACYRKNCASPSSAGQLILPECMKLLPLYVNCILKSDALSGGSDLTLDDRSFTMSVVNTMDIPSSVLYFYPRLLPLHDLHPDSEELPAPIRCSSDKLRDDGVYLLENGIHMFLWVGSNVSLDWTHSVFGDHIAAKIDIDRNSLPNFDNPISKRLRHIIQTVRNQRQRSMKLTIIPQRDKLEVVFKHFLVEDRGMDGSASYVDFLCHMHKEIRNLLS